MDELINNAGKDSTESLEELMRKLKSKESDSISNPLNVSLDPVPSKIEILPSLSNAPSISDNQHSNNNIIPDNFIRNPEYSIDANGVYTTGIFKNDVKVLDSQIAPDYLSKLQSVLDKTRVVINDSRYSLFISKIINSMKILELKYASQKEGYTDMPFAIDPTDSGFPHFGNLQFQKSDIENADSELQRIGAVKDILKSASDKIANGLFPTNERKSLSDYKYFKILSKTEPLKDIELGNIVEEEHKSLGNQRSYKLECWGCDARASNFILYKINFNVDSKNGGFVYDQEIEFQNQLKGNFRQPLDIMFYLFDTIKHIHPKKITKFTIGPYFNEQTINSVEMDKLFAEYNSTKDKKDEKPFIFKISKEKIESVKSYNKYEKFFDVLMNLSKKNQTEVPSQIYTHNYWLTNFRIKQNIIGSSDIELKKTYENIIGLTNQGDLV